MVILILIREEAVQENDEERDTNIPMSILSSDTNDDVEVCHSLIMIT